MQVTFSNEIELHEPNPQTEQTQSLRSVVYLWLRGGSFDKLLLSNLRATKKKSEN